MKIMASFHANPVGFCLPLIHNSGMRGNPFQGGEKGFAHAVYSQETCLGNIDG